MRIVHVAAECAPLAKAGGLGDAVGGLCKEESSFGDDIFLCLPFYDILDTSSLSNLQKIEDLSLQKQRVEVWQGRLHFVTVYLFRSLDPRQFFSRGMIYGCSDDVVRFLHFSLAVASFLSTFSFDVLHLHDWHTACVATIAPPPRKALLTIHNGEYRGKCASWDFAQVDINPPKECLEEGGSYNLLQGGIVCCDRINTVSPTYAKELLQSYPLLQKYRTKFFGILNGIDQTVWNPATDPHLPLPYRNDHSLATIQRGKEAARIAIAKRFHIPLQGRPWIGAITRITAQKGPELLLQGIEATVAKGGTFCLLGTPSNEEMASLFRAAQRKWEKHPQVILQFVWEESLAHQLFAALDFLFAPSTFEPCGLVQMIALRYGTIPIVRKTGGFLDTVFDFEDSQIAQNQRNGFLLDSKDPSLIEPLFERIFSLWKRERLSLERMAKRGMETDRSWSIPAKAYQKLYRQLAQDSKALRM